MVCFQTKNPNMGKYWRVLLWKILVYLMTIWSILRPLEIFYSHLVYFVVSLLFFYPVLVFWIKKNLATLIICNTEWPQHWRHETICERWRGHWHLRGRCSDHNFLRFLPIFVEKLAVFLKTQCCDPYFTKISSRYFEQKTPIFRNFFKKKIY
jgi:hypothetical protein